MLAHPRQEEVQWRRCLEVAEKYGDGYVPEYVVADEREGLRQWVREQLVPMSDLDAVADMFKRDSPNPKTLRSWVRRKQMEARGQVAGVDLFSVKQFLELVDRLPARKATG